MCLNVQISYLCGHCLLDLGFILIHYGHILTLIPSAKILFLTQFAFTGGSKSWDGHSSTKFAYSLPKFISFQYMCTKYIHHTLTFPKALLHCNINSKSEVSPDFDKLRVQVIIEIKCEWDFWYDPFILKQNSSPFLDQLNSETSYLFIKAMVKHS